MRRIKLQLLEVATGVVRLALAATLLVAFAGGAGAQTIEQFYKGRQVSLIVFSGPGSTYDTYARLLARHLGGHIPGKPTFVVQNLLGAGGLKTVDYLVKLAPRDGSVIGTIGRGLPFEPMLGKNEVRFDPLAFTWIGSMNRETTLAMSWHTSKVRTFADLKEHELLVPGTGAGADSEIIPLAINNLAGTRFKIIGGYRDTSEGALAMERGELDGLAYWSWSAIMAAHPDWVRDRKVNLLFHPASIRFRPRPRCRRSATWSTTRSTSARPSFCWRGRFSGGRSWRLPCCPPSAPPHCARASRPPCRIPSFGRTPNVPESTPIW